MSSADGEAVNIVPVRRIKISDAVAAQLEQKITRGDYESGEKLPTERVLADQFGVGRSSMREALRLLESMNLLRTEHGVGTFVTGQDARQTGLSEMLMAGNFTVPDLFSVRRPLEEEAAGLAASRITANRAKALKLILTKAGNPRISDDEFIDLDVRLHRTIVEATGNRLMMRVVESIEPVFFTYSRHAIALPDRRARAHAGHTRIVDAVVGHRMRDARAAAVAHLREVEEDIVAFLDLNRSPRPEP